MYCLTSETAIERSAWSSCRRRSKLARWTWIRTTRLNFLLLQPTSATVTTTRRTRSWETPTACASYRWVFLLCFNTHCKVQLGCWYNNIFCVTSACRCRIWIWLIFFGYTRAVSVARACIQHGFKKRGSLSQRLQTAVNTVSESFFCSGIFMMSARVDMLKMVISDTEAPPTSCLRWVLSHTMAEPRH